VHVTVDRVPRGQLGTAGSQTGQVSAAGVGGDMRYLPFRNGAFGTLVARHVLEHHPDTLGVLREWARVARRLVVVCPDQGTYPGNTVHLDPTHRAAFTRDQLLELAHHARPRGREFAGEVIPGWSFLLVAEAPGS
jgi:ubiquinone/menaquinone biosynthesis C-methylase UbiE